MNYCEAQDWVIPARASELDDTGETWDYSDPRIKIMPPCGQVACVKVGGKWYCETHSHEQSGEVIGAPFFHHEEPTE